MLCALVHYMTNELYTLKTIICIVLKYVFFNHLSLSDRILKVWTPGVIRRDPILKLLIEILFTTGTILYNTLIICYNLFFNHLSIIILVP